MEAIANILAIFQVNTIVRLFLGFQDFSKPDWKEDCCGVYFHRPVIVWELILLQQLFPNIHIQQCVLPNLCFRSNNRMREINLGAHDPRMAVPSWSQLKQHVAEDLPFLTPKYAGFCCVLSFHQIDVHGMRELFCRQRSYPEKRH